MTMESYTPGLGPSPDDEPIRRDRRQRSAYEQESHDDWWLAQEQYERHLDRMAGEDR